MPSTSRTCFDVKNLFVMNVEFYTGIDERLDLPVVLPPTLDVVDLTGARVLVADDVADTAGPWSRCATPAPGT